MSCYAKQSATDALKTSSKWATQKKSRSDWWFDSKQNCKQYW